AKAIHEDEAEAVAHQLVQGVVPAPGPVDPEVAGRAVPQPASADLGGQGGPQRRAEPLHGRGGRRLRRGQGPNHLREDGGFAFVPSFHGERSRRVAPDGRRLKGGRSIAWPSILLALLLATDVG